MTRNEVKKRDKNSDSKVASLDGGDVKPLATMGKVAKNIRKKDVKFKGGGKNRIVGQNKAIKGKSPGAGNGKGKSAQCKGKGKKAC
ncbi:MAG: hypothetical protein HOD90_06415 [Nitrospina sp.]|nr:hypothetical protein [Nitrospina sp.]